MRPFSVATRRKANRNPFKRCPAQGRFQASGNPRPTIHTVGNDVRGATEIIHRVKCHARSGCAASGVNWVRIFKAAVTVSDRTAPLVAITGGALASGRWVSGRQTVQYAALDNVGVRSGRAVGGERATRPERPRPCDYTRLVPCSNGSRRSRSTRHRLRGGHPTRSAVERRTRPATESSRAPRSSESITRRLLASTSAVEGGEGWRRTPELQPAVDQPDRGRPGSDRGRALPRCVGSARTDALERRTAGAGIARLRLTAPAPGEHTVTVWREDAGRQPRSATTSRSRSRSGTTPKPPRPAFDQPTASDPTRVSVSVMDRVSGLAGGGIEIGRVGSGVWQALQTRSRGQQARRANRRLALPAGPVRASCSCGRPGGQRGVHVGRRRRSADDREPATPGQLARCARESSSARRFAGSGVARSAAASDRARALGAGTLRADRPHRRAACATLRETPSPAPASSSYSRTRPRRRAARRRDGHGRWRGAIASTPRASSSRTFRFLYEGSGLILPAQDEVRLNVPAASSIRVSRRGACATAAR